MSNTMILAAALLAVLFALTLLAVRHAKAKAELKGFRERFRGVTDAEAERKRVLSEVEAATASLHDYQKQTQDLETAIHALKTEFAALDEEANLRSFGFYKPRYDFAESSRYQTELDTIRQSQRSMLTAKTAATCAIEWTVNGSKAEGRKSTNHTLKLMLRAFNGESDAAVAKVKYSNVQVMEARIQKAFQAINQLGEVQRCHIADAYLDLRLKELYLVHEYEEKLQEEKEEQRAIRERMREEEIAQREIEKARQEAEQEEQRYQEALEKARLEAEKAVGEKQGKLQDQIQELERRLAEAQANKERAVARAQMTRSGHVYVISNVGSFGEDIYKIGLTRRLDPLERILELGDAAVPFRFDVHAVIFSEDAPALESTLHTVFADRAVNLVNPRKEFFGI